MNKLNVLLIVVALMGRTQESEARDDPCSFSPKLCKNGGKCFYDGEHPSCRCPEGFIGKHCETECVDADSVQCPLWAAQNECNRNSRFMHHRCSKSCLCGCTDHKVGLCAAWAKEGWCMENKKYMEAFCRRSCGFCL